MSDKTPALLILDCDGVLIRSELANLAYYNQLLTHFGHAQIKRDDRDKVQLFHTLSTPQVIERFFTAKERAEVLNYAKRLEYSNFTGMLTVEPGWTEALPRLAGRMKVCVATNRGESVHGLLKSFGLHDWMEKIFTINDVARPKPAPDLLSAALAHFDVAASAAVYVGDSALDHGAATAAGVPFIGYRYPECDSWVSGVSELERLLLPKAA